MSLILALYCAWLSESSHQGIPTQQGFWDSVKKFEQLNILMGLGGVK